MMMVFESENIYFVAVSEQLVKDYLVMVNDHEHVQKYIRRKYVPREPLTEEKEINWVHEKLKEKASIFSMIEKKTGSFIGNIEFMNMNGFEGELGIAITAEKQNKGYGTEAVFAMIEYGIRRLGLKRIILKANPENARAIHVYEKCGFREYHRSDNHVFMETTE